MHTHAGSRIISDELREHLEKKKKKWYTAIGRWEDGICGKLSIRTMLTRMRMNVLTIASHATIPKTEYLYGVLSVLG